MEIEPGIHQLAHGREPLPGFPPPNCFILVGDNATLLVDAGWSNPEDDAARFDYLQKLNAPPVTEMLITHRHPDHGGGALALARATGAPISAHTLEIPFIEKDRFAGKAKVDRELTGGERYDLGGLTAEVVLAPGHTMGCLAVLIPERNSLITTDTVMGVSTTVIRPQEGSLADYERTLDKFAALNTSILFTGHGSPVRDPAARLKALSDHRRRREEELLKALSSEPRSIEELRKTIYIGLPQAREKLAEAQVETGLRKLLDEGRARQETDLYTLA